MDSLSSQPCLVGKAIPNRMPNLSQQCHSSGHQGICFCLGWLVDITGTDAANPLPEAWNLHESFSLIRNGWHKIIDLLELLTTSPCQNISTGPRHSQSFCDPLSFRFQFSEWCPCSPASHWSWVGCSIQENIFVGFWWLLGRHLQGRQGDVKRAENNMSWDVARRYLGAPC